MRYVTIKRFKRRGLGGLFNIPYGTALERRGELLCLDGEIICAARSFVAHRHFARDDDGFGLERGRLTHDIIKTLGGNQLELSDRWQRVFDDRLAAKYRRADSKSYWLWSDDFFAAPIDDLRYLLALVKGDSHV